MLSVGSVALRTVKVANFVFVIVHSLLSPFSIVMLEHVLLTSFQSSETVSSTEYIPGYTEYVCDISFEILPMLSFKNVGAPVIELPVPVIVIVWYRHLG